MKDTKLLWLCILFNLCIIFPASAQSEIEREYSEEGKPSKKSYYEEIPNHYVLGFSFINVSINNKKYRFLLDTGCTSSSIDTSIAEELNLKANYTVQVLDASNIIQSVDYTTVSQITIGDTTFNNVTADIYDFSQMKMFSECLGVKGIIGVDILKHGVCQFSKEQIIITDNINKVNNLCHSKPNKLELTNGFSPLLNVELYFLGENLFKIETLFDSGFNSYFGLSESHLKFIQKSDSSNYNYKLINGTGLSYWSYFKTEREKIDMQKLIVPKYSLSEKSSWSEFDCKIDAVETSIGGRFLELADITIDWKKKKYYIQQNDEKQSKDFGFRYDNNGKINEIWDNSPLMEKGIQFGDVISTIEDKILANEEICGIYLEQLEILSKDTITLRMKDSDEDLTFEQ